MGLFDGATGDGDRFFAMLVQQAGFALGAVRALETVLDGVDAAAVSRMRAVADESAELRRVLVDELHKTFVTPIDREDIFNLAQSYHGMVKYALTTLEEMQILAVAADGPIRRMVALVREQAEELDHAIRRLAKNPRVAGDHANAVHAKEVEVERVYRAAIRDLFAHASDPKALPEIFYRREVYRHISNMSDRADYAATVLGMIVMKLA
ncbi:MAG TPA: DUF47 family protein [Usitatibacter sp.]|nr:DUF47 family protein [Usitatibacter sp.]